MESLITKNNAMESVTPSIKQKQRDPNEISGSSNIVFNVIFIVCCLVGLLPVLLVLAVSFSDENAVTLHGYKLIPETFSLNAYNYLWLDHVKILRAYGVSILVTVAGSLVGLMITVLFAYPLSRRDFSFRGMFAFFIFFTMIFHGGLVPSYLIYSNVFHINDSLMALIVPGHLMGAFYVIMVRTFFQTSIHPSLIESAKIDGAGEARILLRIVLPLSLPVLATIALFYTVGYWNDWFNSLIYINNEKLFSLQYLMYKVLRNLQFLITAAQDNPGSGVGVTEIANLPNETIRMAMCIVGMGPIVLAYPFFQKYFVKGLTIGAIKG